MKEEKLFRANFLNFLKKYRNKILPPHVEILCSIREMVYHINQENNSNEVGLKCLCC
ncbi:hypothetical protein JCM21531_399 [Acetivibrio straminisolvens JCM 21531]|uniref:Uncharacterized protein n=1 Tax=Acetivibrio straminisolvens JCM 21531 TaxID=1294263 RepID=W4V1S4_9FIRM|nr:hypothetical protein JCM21531_399 [Acetivibrio straminisolvens JCM 21531]